MTKQPGKVDSSAEIWASLKSDIKYFGFQSEFQEASFLNAAAMLPAVSLTSNIVATLKKPTFVATDRQRSGKSYRVVRYVASIKHMSLPYNMSMRCCHLD